MMRRNRETRVSRVARPIPRGRSETMPTRNDGDYFSFKSSVVTAVASTSPPRLRRSAEPSGRLRIRAGFPGCGNVRARASENSCRGESHPSVDAHLENHVVDVYATTEPAD